MTLTADQPTQARTLKQATRVIQLRFSSKRKVKKVSALLMVKDIATYLI